MSFSTGNSSQRAEINVTPLIDVLLVLLIIFMIVVPHKPDGLKVQSPPPAKSTTPPPTATIVVQVHAHDGGEPTYAINNQVIAKVDLVSKLKEIFAMREDKVMFVKGDAELPFNSIAEVVSFGQQARVTTIGVLTPKTEGGQ